MTFSLPRPVQSKEVGEVQVIEAPSESTFTAAFGKLLPPAVFLPTQFGNVATYYLSPIGTPHSIPIVLIHGIQTPALGLLPLANHLRKRYPNRPIAIFDLYGHGLSPTPIIAHTPSIFFTAIDILLEHYNWTSADFVGYSFGGSLLAGYTARSPERVHSAVLVAPAGLIKLSSFLAEEQSLLAGGQGADEMEVRKFVFAWLEGGDLVVPKDAEERIRRGEVVAESVRQWELESHEGYAASVVSILKDGGVIGNGAAFVKMAETGVRRMAILGGEDDVCDTSMCKAARVDDVHVIDRAGHALVRTRAEEVADLIQGFWSA